jgi:NAD(P)-dependent dehydrogenase (short-subunit alcohol dehydrogenase family)
MRCENYRGSARLEGRRALVTGVDSGIGRAVSVGFAKEGARLAIAYLEEHDDAKHTRSLVERTGSSCTLIPGDLSQEDHCVRAVPERIWQSTSGKQGPTARCARLPRPLR